MWTTGKLSAPYVSSWTPVLASILNFSTCSSNRMDMEESDCSLYAIENTAFVACFLLPNGMFKILFLKTCHVNFCKLFIIYSFTVTIFINTIYSHWACKYSFDRMIALHLYYLFNWYFNFVLVFRLKF